MLARAQRIHLPTQFRRVIRRGVKSHRPTLICYAVPAETKLSRFGFVVSKNVGPAVTRNLVKRRLRAAVAALETAHPLDVVIRALPEAGTASWQTLQADVQDAVAQVAKSSN